VPERWIADSKPSIKFPIYTRANAGEVMPDPVSPMSASIGLGGTGEMAWRDAYVQSGCFDADEFEPDRPNTIGIFGGYVFLNMSTTRVYGVRMPGWSPEMVDLQYFGDMPGITPYADEARPDDESPRHSELLAQFMNHIFTRDDLPELRADRDEVDRVVARRPVFDLLTDQELVDHARSHLPLYRRLFSRHIVVSAGAGIGIGAVGQVCQAIDRPDLLMTLLSGVGDVDSAMPSWALWDLSRIVASSTALTAAFDKGLPGLVDRVEELADAGNEAAASFAAKAHEFLERFGSRGPNEWEFRSSTWGTNPLIALAAVDRMRLAPDDESPQDRTERRVAEREAATAEVRALVAGDPEVAATFDAGLRAALLYNAGRERTKTTNIKIVHEIRLAMRELGERLVARGLLESVEQVFMFVDGELDIVCMWANREQTLPDYPDFSTLARERETTYLSLFDVEPPFVTHGPPPPPSEWRRRDEGQQQPVAEGTVLTGITGCPGVAVGRARVVLDPTDPRGLEPGDVLVAPLTDPAWTPLFVPAAAVVVDVGAQITHAVIVSRELGLPCVVSVIDATKKIPDGALVEVDGTSGTVKVLHVPSTTVPLDKEQQPA